MSDTLSISRNELSSIRRELVLLRSYAELNDIVNRKTAIELMDVTPETFSAYLSTGKVAPVSINKKTKQKFFSRKQIMGI